MSLFTSKKKKEQRRLEALKREEQLIEEQRRKEQQSRMNIKRTLLTLKSQTKKMEQFKSTCISRARQALRSGNQDSYRAAKAGLKICLTKQRMLDSMLINFEIKLEINDMNKVIEQFVIGINDITNQMKEVSDNLDLTKAQESFDQAMMKNTTNYEALENYLVQAVDSFESMDLSNASISDDEIDHLISNQAMDLESSLDKEIETKIEQVRDKLIS